MKDILKDKVSASLNLAHNILSNRAARNALKVIEKEKGPFSITLRDQCDKYAKSYLGDSKYAPWLYVYSAIQGEFKPGWIPDNYYGEVIVRSLDGIFASPAEVKPLSNRILKTHALPDILYTHKGLFFDPTNYQIIPETEVVDYLFSTSDTVIFKSNNSSQGKGVSFQTKETWDLANIKKTSGVFQRVIEQHDFFNNIFPHPGATLRITTALNNDGTPTVRAATLRIAQDDKTSSKHVQSKSAVKIAVDINNGKLFETGYAPDWSSITSHPDTGVFFKDLTIPAFRNACTEVENLHKNYPFVDCIGWDVSINQQEQVEIMEWNAGHNDIKFSEAMYGPCFTDILERSIVLSKNL